MDNEKDIPNEILELIIKAGRRCAYDLRHAADGIGYEEHRKLYLERAEMWLSIFNPANGPKDYRSKLHDKINHLEARVKTLEALCKENKINYSELIF